LQPSAERKESKKMKNTVWATLTIVMVVVVLFFGLRPKTWPAANEVHWMPDEKALRFRNPGMAYVDDLRFFHGDRDLSEFSIEMVVKTETVRKTGFRPLLVIHDGEDRRQLAVWQWGASVIVMNGDDYDYTRRWPRVYANNVFSPGTMLYLTITGGESGTCLYLDGALAAQNSEWKAFVPQKGKKCRLIIGNSVYGKHSWTGDFYGLAISGDTITAEDARRHFKQWAATHDLDFNKQTNQRLLFTFKEKTGNWIPDQVDGRRILQIPAHITALKTGLLSSPWHTFTLNRAFLIDAVLNVIGFAPLGFFLHGWLTVSEWFVGIRKHMVTVFFCLMLSLAIEIAQAYLPARFSSLMDVILNTLGGGLGVLLFSRMGKTR
jgi:VanZ like family